MKRTVFLPIMALLLATPMYIFAQDAAVVEKRINETALPEEIRAAVSESGPLRIVSTSGNYVIDDQILRVDELVIQPGSIIQFPETSAPFVAIIAERVRIIDPDTPITFRRNPAIVAPRGQPGANGSTGPRGLDGKTSGNGSKHGSRGGRGSDGSNGKQATPYELPDVWIVFGNIEDAATGAPILLANLEMDFRGVSTGPGGNGGKGGRGGRGGNGRDGRANLGVCSRGPGNGGDGGRGGNGGNGADGVQGGDGADIFLVSNRAGIDLLSSARFRLSAGEDGEPGAAGERGERGRPGSRGGQPGTCQSDGGSSGPLGLAGKAGSEAAESGRAGVIIAYIVDGLEELVN